MTHVIGTGMISVAVPGSWRRLGLICRDGPLSRLAEHQLTARLEELGIPRHHYGLVRVMLTWRAASIPPDVAFALWLLRKCSMRGGGIPRRLSLEPEDTGPTIRYMQLAMGAGETFESDPALLVLAQWLVELQLPDGSIPANLGTAHGEAGSTARALRILLRASEPALNEPIAKMRGYLHESAVHGPHGAGWCYSVDDRTMVTGATSLVTLALLECDPTDTLLPNTLEFLYASQNSGGGWSEVPGYRAMEHNTFNVLRAIRAARSAGLTDERAEVAIATAERWFRRAISRNTKRTTLDLAYALRLATELDLLHERGVVRMGRQLAQRRSEFLNQEADLYAETEIAAIALLECSRKVDHAASIQGDWEWRWSLPSIPPPFLRQSAYIYEVLYGAVNAHWWVKAIDFLVRRSVVEKAAAVLLGTIATLGIVDDHITETLVNMGTGIRGHTVLSLLGTLLMIWIFVKWCAYSSFSRAVRSTLLSLLLAVLLTFIFLKPSHFYPSIIALTLLRWLILDVVAYTADSTGLLKRLLIR